MSDLLIAEGITKRFRWRDAERPWRGRWLTAINGVSLRVAEGSCTAVAGESGSGKTTLGRCLVRLVEPDEGVINVSGEALLELTPRALRRRRRDLQMVFQDAGTALDPRLRIGAQVAEPLRVHHIGTQTERPRRVAALLERVGLPAAMGERYPHQLSGGQRQRACIARALASSPSLLVLDEPVSSLDVSVQARILSLLGDLRQHERLTMIFISHDLAVVDQVADRVAILYAGRLVEEGPRHAVMSAPRHPYTVALLAAGRGTNAPLSGDVPSPLDPPSGCAFHPRCPVATDRCRRVVPQRQPIATVDGKINRENHTVACHHPSPGHGNHSSPGA